MHIAHSYDIYFYMHMYSTFEVLLTAAMVAGVLSIGFTSLTDACLQCNNINYDLICTYIMVHMYNFVKKYLYRKPMYVTRINKVS